MPPPPVNAVFVSGRFSCWRSRSDSDFFPPLSGSTSTTKKPAPAPVATPTFALGHFFHHSRMVCKSVVASLNPFFVRGCLPGRFAQFAPALHVQTPFAFTE